MQSDQNKETTYGSFVFLAQGRSQLNEGAVSDFFAQAKVIELGADYVVALQKHVR